MEGSSSQKSTETIAIQFTIMSGLYSEITLLNNSGLFCTSKKILSIFVGLRQYVDFTKNFFEKIEVMSCPNIPLPPNINAFFNLVII
jgi:hypothetical protein